MIDAIRDFLKLEAASGVLLVIGAICAMVVANSPLATYYTMLIDLPIEIRVGTFEIAKPMLLWINDGLMALFFFLVGLELKREIVEGELSRPSDAVLPAVGAIGGMAFPALVATDIAFALAVLTLLGDRVPLALRLFLVTIAIFDDVGAIVIIAIFYTSELSTTALGVAGACLAVLFTMNRRGLLEKTPYVLVGIVMWVAVLKSGVHATLAGIALAFFIPIRDSHRVRSPLHELEHDLHTAVAYTILPLFAFVNGGIPLRDVSLDYVLHPVSIGIALGLFIGKQLWIHVYGTAMLCGIGFTMSLFIGSLAFGDKAVDMDMLFDERLGIMIGSLLSAAGGFLLLRTALPDKAADAA